MVAILLLFVVCCLLFACFLFYGLVVWMVGWTVGWLDACVLLLLLLLLLLVFLVFEDA